MRYFCLFFLLTAVLYGEEYYPFLFRVTGNEIASNQEVYLFGTCHDEEASHYPPAVLRKIQKCDLLLTEFPVRLMTAQNTQAVNRNEYVKVRGAIQEKLLNFDEEWFRTNLLKLEKSDVDDSIALLKQKSEELIQDKKTWQPLQKESIQRQLDPYD
jgi:hypothetical protein